MPSLTEIRKISLNSLHRSATQNWGKQHPNSSSAGDKKFQRSSSMPALKSWVKNGRTQSMNNLKVQKEMTQNGYDTNSTPTRISSISDFENDLISNDTERAYQNIVFGFQNHAVFDQPPKTTDFMSVLYNGRVHRFFLLDSRGILSWNPGLGEAVKRELHFPKYKTKLLRSIIFCKKYNVFFAICNDFTLKVYNKDFQETFKTENKSMRSILHLIFNPVTDQLITSGVVGTIVWKYKQMRRNLFDTLKPMANYELEFDAEYSDIGGNWCTKVELITSVQYLIYCSDADLYAYDARDMRKLFVINGAHTASLTCVGFSLSRKSLLTGSLDCELKVWGASGGHVCTLRGHSRPVTSIINHPDIPGLVFSSSMDGTIKVWSLHTMDLFTSLSVLSDGIRWMNLTDEGMIWCANLKKISVFNFTSVVSFWGHTRCCINDLQILEHPGKTKRLMAVGEDSSVRLFSQSRTNTTALCTVLPPPVVSLLDNICDVTHSRYNHLFFILINSSTIWIYTATTDPACRTGAWDIPMMLKKGLKDGADTENIPTKSSFTTSLSSQILRSFEEKKVLHSCTQILSGTTTSSECHCILAVYSQLGFQYDSPLGRCSARTRHLLLLGLEDGRIIFVDQKQHGLLYCELKVSKNPIKSMKFEYCKDWLITRADNTIDIIFQIWKLPELELLNKISTQLTFSCFTVLDNTLITGHSTGHINLYPIISVDGNMDKSSEKETLHPEHKNKIIDVKSCRKQNVFCSCSANGEIKLWDSEKTLLIDIKLDEDLTCCNFLNEHGDLVVGWKRHLFVIDRKILSLGGEKDESLEEMENESDIYEDPAVRYESGLKTKPSTITMYKYLVPYGFVNAENNDDAELKKLQAEDKAESETSDESEHTLCAMTDTYLSPAISMESFGIIDALFPSKSPDVTDKSMITSDIMFPEFGRSPGSTPAESIVSDEIIETMSSVSDDVIDHSLMPEEKQVDLKEKLSTGVAVAKAIKKMSRKKLSENLETEPVKSRFANAEVDAKDMMKKGMNVVFALESMQKDKKKKTVKSAHGERPSSAKNLVKKTRRPSTASSRRKSLTGTDVPLQPWKLKEDDDRSAGDSDSSHVENQQHRLLDTKAVEKKLVELGFKMTPHQKVESSAAQFQRRKQATASAKPHVQVSSRLKRKISKSATVNRRKSLTSRDRNQFPIVNIDQGAYSTKAQNQGPISQIHTSRHARIPATHTNGTTLLEKSRLPGTSNYMKYGDQVATKSENLTNYKDMQQMENMKNSNGMIEETTSKDILDDSLQSSSQVKNKRRPMSEPQLQSINNEGGQDADLLNTKEILDKQRIGVDEEDSCDDDDDEMIIPNLLEYDFHAIYKKDGLQFDEKWQDRMLERYLLLKLQKKQRQEAAMNKRIFLEQERQFRLLASQPELLQRYQEPWYEDPDILANFILNSSLMKGGETPSNHLESNDFHLYKRPISASSVQRVPSDRGSERDRRYRFSIRDHSTEDVHERTNFLPKSTKTSSTPSVKMTPVNSSMSMRTKSSSSSFQKLATERPRSSTSIPGKTRYILIKSGKTKKPEKAPNLTKLEETLLKKRFPSQHVNVMKSLGRLDELQLSESADNLSVYDENEYFSSRAGTPISANRDAQTLSASIGQRGKPKSEIDAQSLTMNAFSKGVISAWDNSEISANISNTWMSPSSNVYINPLDIVKRKSTGNISNQKSVHA